METIIKRKLRQANVFHDVLCLEQRERNEYKNVTIYEQICIAYIQGKCDYELKNYKEAFEELRFVIKYGGSTKYVKLANCLLEKIPEKNLPEKISAKKYIRIKHGMNRKIFFLTQTSHTNKVC